MASVEGLEPRMQAFEGGQDSILGFLRDQGLLLTAQVAWLGRIDEKLAEHDARFDRVDARLDMIVDWIQPQP